MKLTLEAVYGIFKTYSHITQMAFYSLLVSSFLDTAPHEFHLLKNKIDLLRMMICHP